MKVLENLQKLMIGSIMRDEVFVTAT